MYSKSYSFEWGRSRLGTLWFRRHGSINRHIDTFLSYMLTCPFFLECGPFRSSKQKNGKRSFPFLLFKIGPRSFPVPFQFPNFFKKWTLVRRGKCRVLLNFGLKSRLDVCCTFRNGPGSRYRRQKSGVAVRRSDKKNPE